MTANINNQQVSNKTAEEILKKKFIPYVCSDTYFDHCLERKGEFLSNVTQGLEAMYEFASISIAEKEVTINSLELAIKEYKDAYSVLIKKTDLLNEELESQKQTSDKLAKSIQYYFDVLREVRGEDWDKKPDHVLTEFINSLTTYKKSKLTIEKKKDGITADAVLSKYCPNALTFRLGIEDCLRAMNEYASIVVAEKDKEIAKYKHLSNGIEVPLENLCEVYVGNVKRMESQRLIMDKLAELLKESTNYLEAPSLLEEIAMQLTEYNNLKKI